MKLIERAAAMRSEIGNVYDNDYGYGDDGAVPIYVTNHGTLTPRDRIGFLLSMADRTPSKHDAASLIEAAYLIHCMLQDVAMIVLEDIE